MSSTTETMLPSERFWLAMQEAADRYVEAGAAGAFKRNGSFPTFYFAGVLIATCGGRELGAPDKYGRIPFYSDYAGLSTVIEQITVPASSRGNGLGTTVMEGVIALARKAGVTLYVHIHPTEVKGVRATRAAQARLVRWYERLGFEVTEGKLGVLR